MDSIKHILKPREKDIGEFSVRRALPFIKQRSIGPWIFFDHFGPVDFAPGEGMNVRPHPHINLATVTYLFEGEIYHRDTLGNALPIHPGAINLMVAGKGIAHSERTRDELRETGYRLHGLQLWHALPEEFEEVEPAFYHTPAADIPSVETDGVTVRVMMGTAFGATSPVKTFSPNLYLEADMQDGATMDVPQAEELGIYVVKGEADIDGETAPINAMSVLNPSAKVITAKGSTRLAIIGGAPLGKRHLWWNFVSSRKERIEQAKEDWKNGAFGDVPGDSEERIPLPD
ncbi:pirin family protein [Hellea balneolensis]|uniref:pirin family protein n=1 Tax=Hellea balneolensis TaxID=287478 RepID=UPI0004220FBA|nr:pirin family protein [Hellea balneolensis]